MLSTILWLTVKKINDILYSDKMCNMMNGLQGGYFNWTHKTLYLPTNILTVYMYHHVHTETC